MTDIRELAPGPPALLLGTIEGRPRRGHPAGRSRSTHRSCAKSPIERVIERNPAVQLLFLLRGRRAVHAQAARRSRSPENCGWRPNGAGEEPARLPAICCKGPVHPSPGQLGRQPPPIHTAIWGPPGPRSFALWPGLKNEAYGIACDIGSTTVAMHLVSLLSGRIRGFRRCPKPADPLRRGSG